MKIFLFLLFISNPGFSANLEDEILSDLSEFQIDDFEVDDSIQSLESFDENITTAPVLELDDNTYEQNKAQTLDFSALEDLKKKRELNINRIIEAKKRENKQRYTNGQIEAYKVQLSDIIKSPTRPVVIPRQTRLIRLEDDKFFYTPKSISTRAHTLLDASKNRYIVDKSGEIKYKVYFNEITDISRITELHHEPHNFKRLKKIIKPKVYDDKFKFSLKANMNMGLYRAYYTKSLINHNADLLPLIRFESGLLTNHSFDYQAGLVFAYEAVNGTTEGAESKFNYKSFSLGPSFQSKPLLWDYSIIVQSRLSIFSSISIANSNKTTNYNLSETSLLIGLEKKRDFKNIGKYIYGANFQRKWVRANASGIALDVGSHVDYDDSFALSIGFITDFQL